MDLHLTSPSAPAPSGTSRAHRLLRDLLVVLGLGLALALLRSASAGAAPGVMTDPAPVAPVPAVEASQSRSPVADMLDEVVAPVRPVVAEVREAVSRGAAPAAPAPGSTGPAPSRPADVPAPAPASAPVLDPAPIAADPGLVAILLTADAADADANAGSEAEAVGERERPGDGHPVGLVGHLASAAAEAADVLAPAGVPLGGSVPAGPWAEPDGPLDPIVADVLGPVWPFLGPVLDQALPMLDRAVVAVLDPLRPVLARLEPAGLVPGPVVGLLPSSVLAPRSMSERPPPALEPSVPAPAATTLSEAGPARAPGSSLPVASAAGTDPDGGPGGPFVGPEREIPEPAPALPAPGPYGPLPFGPGPGAGTPLAVLSPIDAPAVVAAGLVPASSPDATSATGHRPGYSPD